MTSRNKKIADALSKMTERTVKWLSRMGGGSAHAGSVGSHGVASTHGGSVGSGHAEAVG
jgi:hypothetical protein